VEFSNFNSHKIERLKVAHLYERYRYFPNKLRDEYSYGQANTFIANYDYKYRLDKITLNGIVDLSSINAKGTSIENANRDQLSGTFLFSHDISEKINYGVNLRKEWVSDYDSPFLFSLDSRYKVTKNYTLTINASKNYRVPTFNDLYWTGAGAKGNLEVLPETSWQLEIGQDLTMGNYHFSVNGYTILSDDLIQWRPNEQGVWMAMNVQDVSQYGLELGLDWQRKWGHQNLVWENEYAFTRSMDNRTENQLMYVPEHRLRSNLAYQYKRVTAFYQLLYTGSVFTTTDNSSGLPGYLVAHMGMDYRWPIIAKVQIDLGLKINNIFNKEYQNVAYRPMPNRNIQFHISTKF
jgi:iron complex outermembrane receptor protein